MMGIVGRWRIEGGSLGSYVAVEVCVENVTVLRVVMVE